VREITETDVKELFPVRAALERLAAELAAPRLTGQELQKLKKIIERMEIVNQKGDSKTYLKGKFMITPRGYSLKPDRSNR